MNALTPPRRRNGALARAALRARAATALLALLAALGMASCGRHATIQTANPTTPVRTFLEGLTSPALNSAAARRPATLPAQAQACGRLALEARQLSCLKAYIRHRPVNAPSYVTVGERLACRQLTPAAAGQMALVPLGIDPVGLALLDAYSGAESYPVSCPYALAAMNQLGAIDRAVGVVMDPSLSLEATNAGTLPMKVIARQGHYATVRVGDSQSAVEVVHTGGRWLIARLNVN